MVGSEIKSFIPRDLLMHNTRKYEICVSKDKILQIIKEANLMEFIKKIACDIQNEKCMDRECWKCKNLVKLIIYFNSQATNFYHNWVSEKVLRIGDKIVTYRVKVTQKKTISCPVSELVNDTHKYNCKYGRENATHFGASKKKQVCMHAGRIFYKLNEENKFESFIVVSNDFNPRCSCSAGSSTAYNR